MSRIFLIGDTHISLGYPNTVEKWHKIHVEYFDNFLIPLLKKEVKKGDIVAHLGDLFDNRSIIPINLLNYGMDIIEKISSIAPLHILIGNHDLWTKSASEINTIRPFKYIPNVFIYDSPKKIEYNGKSILMMPYIDKKRDQIEILKKYSGCDYLFCHSDLNGAKMHLTSVAHKNLDKIDVEEFSGYKIVKTGHIHIRQSIDNVEFVGNTFEMDRNDRDNQKGITILDTSDDTQIFVPNLVSPKFKKVYLSKEDDIDNLDNYSTKDYIDLFISNSLLINNRKLRRKLEQMLENGNFATVEYLDDISDVRDEKIKDINGDIIMENTNQEIESSSIGLEYKDIIRNYISDKKWDSEKIKNGIIQEFNEVLNIYENNYKLKIDE